MRLTRRHMLASAAMVLVPGAAQPAVPDARDIADPADRARYLHDLVRDQVQFGWTANFYAETPDETQAAQTGYCITKGALLVRDLRANAIPARMVFAEIDAGILHGLIDSGTPWLDHVYVEADLPDGRVTFDSHIVDLPLFDAAKRKLAMERRAFGYGIHSEGSTVFPAFSQYVPGPVRGQVWGAFETVSDFQQNAPRVWNRLPWIARLAFGFFADAANAKARRLRETL